MPFQGAGKLSRAAILFCLLLAGWSFLGIHQGIVGMSAAAQSGSSFNLHVDVELVTIEVSVIDKDGKAVRHLKKEDFSLFEDGKRQDILSFDEVEGQSATSPQQMPLMDQTGQPRGKTVMILFVDSGIAQRYVKTSRESAWKYVRDHMQPQDLFAVGTYLSSLQMLQNFTHDREEVLAAIEKSGAYYGTGMFYFEDLLRSLEQVNYAIAKLKGQKSVLLYADIRLGGSPSIRTPYTNALTSARRSNVVYYTADPNVEFAGSSPAVTFSPRVGGDGRSPSSSGGVVPVTLMSLARDSGGFSIYNTTSINEELHKLDTQISNYYVLGFQSSNAKHDGSFRKVEVKSNLKGISLKHRAGYQDRSPIDVLASSRQEQKLMTALATPGTSTQLPVAFRPMYFYDAPRAARVLVAARVKMDKAEFRKKGSQLGTDLYWMGIAYAEDGSIAARFSETLPVAFDKDREQEFRKGSLAYRNYFKVRPGKYRLRLAVSDESSNLGSVEQVVEVPPFPTQGVAGSSIVFIEQMSRLPSLIQNLQDQMLDQSDPLVYSGMQIEPGVENRFPVQSSLRLLFKLYNLSGGADGWNLEARPKLVDEKGVETILNPIPLSKSISPAAAGEGVVALMLTFKGVAPGKYRLILQIAGGDSGNPAIVSTDLEFMQ